MNRFAAFALAFLLAAPAAADVISDAKSAISAKMLDPGSAQWRGLRAGTGADGSPVVCGEMLARNTFGGYTGWQPFAWTGGELFTPRRMRELGAPRLWSSLLARCH